MFNGARSYLNGDSEEFHRIIIQSNSHRVVNSINEKISVPKDIGALLEDIRKLLPLLSESKAEFVIGRLIVRDRLAKMALM